MAGVEPGVISEPIEQFGRDVAIELLELFWSVGFADTSGKQGIAGEQVSHAIGVVVDQDNRAGSVSSDMDDFEFARSKLHPGSINHRLVDCNRNVWDVEFAGNGACVCRLADLSQRTPMVAMVMGGDDCVQSSTANVFGDGGSISRCVDKYLLIGELASQQIDVVGQFTDGEFGDLQVFKFAGVCWPVDADFSGVGHVFEANASAFCLSPRPTADRDERRDRNVGGSR